MENASKALIIAGAILLAILIISLGIMIYNQASGVVDSNAMDEAAVTSFNQKFRQYEGNNIRGSNVNAMIDTIIQNNLSNSDDPSKQIKIMSNGLTTADWNGTLYPTSEPTQAQTSTKDYGEALTGRSYKITFTPDDKSGYYTKCTIEKAQ